MFKKLLDEQKIKRAIFYFVLIYFVMSQWHRFFWKEGGKWLLGDSLNLLWIPAALYLLLWLKTKRFPLHIPNTSLDFLFILFLVYAALQLIWATDKETHLQMIVVLVQLYFAYWFITSALESDKNIEELLTVIIITQTILSFLAVLISYANADNEIIRSLLAAFGGNVSFFGASLFLSLSFSLPLLSSDNKTVQLASSAAVVLIPPAIVGSTSRTPTIAAIFCFVIAFPFLLKTTKHRTILVAVYSAAIILSIFLYTAAYERSPFLLPAQKPDRPLSTVDTSLSGRLPIWLDAKQEFLKNPILGQGYFKKDFYLGGIEGDVGGAHPHNQPLLFLCYYGLLGLMIALAVVTLSLITASKLKKSPSFLYSAVATATAMFIAMNSIYSFPECFFPLYYRSGLLYVYFFGILVCTYRRFLSENEQQLITETD